MQNSAQRAMYGKRMGIFGILSNLVLFVVKLIAGIFASSISVAADALNNLSDAGSSLLTLVGFHLSGRPSDKEHPYGHARMEYITGLILSISVIFIGLGLIGESFDKILHPVTSSFRFWTGGILLFSIAVKILQGCFYRKASRKMKSATLHAASIDSFSDAGVTTAVLAGGLLERYFSVDGYLGLLVSVCIMITGIKLVKETSDPLLGIAPSEAMTEEIKSRLRSNKNILGFHDLIIHSYGEGRNFASVHVEVNAHISFPEVHDIIDGIERSFAKESGLQMVIHPDPVDPDDNEAENLKKSVKEILFRCYPEATLHDFHIIRGGEEDKLLFDIGVTDKCRESDRVLCDRITDEIRKNIPNVHAVITVDRNFTSSVPEN